LTITSNAVGQQRWSAALMSTYGAPELTLTHGSGATVYDASGNEYLDLTGGIAVNALGHAHPDVVRAVGEQIGELGHTSNLYANPRAVELAEQLLEVAGVSGNGRVMFVNSGTEANEAALKLSRRTGRSKIVACTNGFHGRTMGALSLTGQPSKRDPFAPLLPGIEHVPYGDAEALRAAVDADTAAVLVEPILGESGVLPAPDGYLRAAREITTSVGALLMLDEVQTGIARTGSWFAFQQTDIVPDVITLAKGLGGGLPFGAVIGVGSAGELFGPGDHGATFGGNPVCAAAGSAVLRVIARDGLNEHVAALGKEITRGVMELEHPAVSTVRGAGLLLGIGLRRLDAKAVSAAGRELGYLINPVTPDTIRLAPPLILSHEQAQQFLRDLPRILDSTETDGE